MALKPPELLNRLPSVAELLDKPPIRALADRWNRSSVAAGVRSFLDELRTDLQRRAADLPSLRELAERAAKYVAHRQHHSLGVVINATGRICDASWLSEPLAEIALERTIAFGREFAANPRPDGGGPSGELATLLCKLTGAQAAVVVNSYDSAIWLTLSAIAADREVLVARGEVAKSGDDSLPRLAAAARVLLKEVGRGNHAAAADFEAATSARTAAIFKACSDSRLAAADASVTAFSELIAFARERGLLLVESLGAAPLVNPPESIAWPHPSAQAALAAGVNLVILRGDGMVNGPACGILLGSDDLINRIVNHPLFAACQLDPLRTATLLATVECYEHPSLGTDSLPLWSCLATSIENLRNRAERMAAQLAHADGVASSVAVETRSPLTAELAADSWPSFGVALTASSNDITSLDHQLRSARFPVFGRIEGDQLILDLRTVLPRQDKLIVDSLLGHSPADRTT